MLASNSVYTVVLYHTSYLKITLHAHVLSLSLHRLGNKSEGKNGICRK